ncbi:hypothetical protein PLESTB_000401400 [Pleodorina starrii]|uniref:Ribosome biogenesis protein NSA1 n=1 Tax=Pleodorina starrii TaxID=330485 RepID=A0A9W6BFH8_9CHLO|nr:hypothetical protein PLESTB_000401400 [Pleodorina starrii]
MGEGGKRKAQQEEAPAPPSHRILTSDELGLLKVTEVPAGSKWEETAAKQRWGQPDKQQGVTRLQVHCPDWDQDRILIAAGRAGGRVTLHCPASAPADGSVSGLGSRDLGSFRAAPPATTSGRSDTSSHELRGLRFAPGGEGSQRLRLVTATAGGHVAVHEWEAQEGADQQQQQQGGDNEDEDGGGGDGGVVRTWQQQQHWREVVRLQTVGDLQGMDVSSSGRYVAVGGEGHQLRVWDLTAAAAAAAGGTGSSSASGPAPEPLFAGKAGKPSRSGLQDLAHVTAVSYVPGRDDQLVLVGTAKHKLWLYDMRAGRKPQSEVVWSDGRITALLPQADGSLVWVGNGRGQVEALDLRQAPGRVTMGHALKGSAGSIRSLSLHPSQPLIASVSLDRHLRVHSTTSRQLLTKVYLKQALTGVAWLPAPTKGPGPVRGGAGDDEGEVDGEEDGDDDDEDEADEEEGRGGRAARGREQPSGGGKAPRRRDMARQQGSGGKDHAKGKDKGSRDKGAKEKRGKDKSQKRARRDGGDDA